MSYELLIDLEKRFPPVTVAKMVGSSSDVTEVQLVINSEDIAAEVCHDDSKSLGVGPDSDGRGKRLSHDIMAKIMMFQYLVTLLETDFICRCQVFKRNREWALIRDSFLNQLLGSQRANLKKIVMSSLHITASKARESFDSNDSKEHSADGIFKNHYRILTVYIWLRLRLDTHSVCQYKNFSQ